MWASLHQQEWVEMKEEKSKYPKEESAIATAVLNNDLNKLEEILTQIEGLLIPEILNRVKVNERPLLHHMVLSGSKEMLWYLIKSGINGDITNSQGRSVLHEAVRTGQLDVVENLLQRKENRDESDGLSTIELAYDSVAALATTGHLVNLQDQAGLTPLLLLAETSTISPERFGQLVDLLLSSGANARKLHPGTGQNVLYRAVELDHLPSCKLLIDAGVSVEHQDFLGNTVLHLAAKLDHSNTLELLLQKSKQSVNCKNHEGDTPVHCAAIAGSRECVNMLLNHGGDLSAKNNEYETAVETIFCNFSRPTAFLKEILDSKIVPNQHSINGQQFEMTLDFRILTPNRKRQMSVLVAIMNTLQNMTHKDLLQHPLIETYLRFKWTRMRIFFLGLAFIHFIFVLSLSCHVILLLDPTDTLGIQWSRRALLAAATLLLGHLFLQILLAPRYFFHETETWLSLTCVLLAFLMSLTGEVLPEPMETQEWIRHVASFSVLLSWVQLMFILGRFPAFGFFALMFFTVFKNMLKVLLIFACLVIGFSLSFCVQFNDFGYDGPWKAFLRTVVMLMGEYEYEDIFRADVSVLSARWDDKPSHLNVTSHIIFLLFILLGSVVLMNLMIGMAVNDIQGLQAMGNLRHMIKQAEFLLHMDRLLVFSKFFKRRKTLPAIVTLNPSTKKKLRESRLGAHLTIGVIERLVEIALKNQRRESQESNMTLNEPRQSLCDCKVNMR